MDRILRDLRYAIRVLFRSPGIYLVVIITLGLGIGANTLVFGVVNAILLRPLQFSDPGRLVMIKVKNPSKGMDQDVVSYPDFNDWARYTKTFDGLAATTSWQPTLTGVSDPEQLDGAVVSTNVFDVLGVPPRLGRGFNSADGQPGSTGVVIISDAFWKTLFGSQQSAINRHIVLDGKDYSIIGVMPQSFEPASPVLFGKAEIWKPLILDPAKANRQTRFLQVIARIHNGSVLDDARLDISNVSANLQATYPEADAGWQAYPVPLQEELVKDIRPSLMLLFACVVFVLLIACANVANLLLARSLARRKESAVRVALGGDKGDLIRQHLTESALLAVIGSGLGLVMAYWGTAALVGVRESSVFSIPRLSEVAINWQVLAFTLVICVTTGLLFGLLPAIQASKANLSEILKENGWSSSGSIVGRRFGKILVISEVAMAVPLLICALLTMKSFIALQDRNVGFNPQNLLTMRLSLPSSRYKDPAAKIAFYDQLTDRMKSVSGVTAAGAISDLPLSEWNTSFEYTIEGRPSASSGEKLLAEFRTITPDYFQAMGIPLKAGRIFDIHDSSEAAKVIIINDTMARRYWPGENPVGRRVTFNFFGTDVTAEIAGVAGDVTNEGLASEIKPTIYQPYDQGPRTSMFVIARTSGDPMKTLPLVRSRLWDLDKDLPASQVQTMDQVAFDSVAEPRVRVLLLTVFAALALFMTAAGIYSVIAYAVSQRTHEIGIRMAIGADDREVVKMIVKEALTLTVIGIVVGLAGAAVLVRLLTTVLFGVQVSDPTTYLSVIALLLTVALLASFLPSRRATRVDPIAVLRE